METGLKAGSVDPTILNRRHDIALTLRELCHGCTLTQLINVNWRWGGYSGDT
jgi:hypothetical protein